ncbi:Helicase, C-terminal:Type III restriction enzyme [Myxococcus hansupus]|uniref:Helicase, C-terminal:Type III restriction enzyme n=1 Tax=Pseudomyxococcus hansupus TaxID=1297742 RepID=A0A0H4X3I6_9BACT|nr:DEAD/DEAH box helicase [Myxococcus hansupus]AKQ68205.1 Helicase, C-terminal:Type III restriction enzyme [Myxococcus hansupus]
MSNVPTGPVLDIFALRDFVIAEYKHFATSFTTIHAPDIKAQVEAIYAQERYWPEPLIQINPSYKRSIDIRSLVAQGALDPVCAEIFQTKGTPLSLYKHQEQAVALAEAGESYVVTTGTGSGKSLCFFIPIVHRVLTEKKKRGQARTRAIIIYPMNALANSQLEELGKFVGNVAGAPPITFARYTGQEDAEERKRIADNPPDILLTNFMMLELLMTRQEEVDRRVIDNCVGLRFLVLDELHTYRGRQGADVALLVRRVRERLRPEQLQCIGTSATMASEGSIEDKSRVVARVASKLFAAAISESNVIVETLERITDPSASGDSVVPGLAAVIDAGISPAITNAELAKHPLSIWVETRLGVTFSDVDQRWVRARPMTVTEAVTSLAAASGRAEAACRAALRDLLLVSSVPEKDRTRDDQSSARSFFAFKLHQFISGAGHAYATLEAAGQRTVTVDGQQFLPSQPEKRLYPIHFCRECGHEYHPVRLVDDNGQRTSLPRSIDDAPVSAGDDAPSSDGGGDDVEQFGFITIHPLGDADFAFNDRDEDFPETWIEYDAGGNARLKPYYRGARPATLHVAPDGRIGSGTRVWFIPGKFRFCLRCGFTQGGAARDRTRLASLSAEGRSSATTVLVASVLRWMHGAQSGLEVFTRKLLGFTDNRQDAALQAGHFNDFLFVSLIRAGFLGALRAAGNSGLRSDEVGAAQQRALGFDRTAQDVRAEWLQEPVLKGFNLQEAESTLRQVLAYRVWYDQRRGWRYTNPNLEQLGLVRVEYQGLDALAADQDEFANAHPLLKSATADVRANLYRELLDHLRKWMAIKSQVLDATVLEQMVARAHSRIRTPWGFGADEKPRGARWLMIAAPKRKENSLRDMDLIVRGGSRSALGRTLRESRLWNGNGAARNLKSKELDALISDLLRAASAHGLVSEENTPFDQPGWRLNDAAVLFRLGEPNIGPRFSTENAFFRDLYGNLAEMLSARMHPLFGFEAREHTAQVDGERRAVREKRFRYGEKEREELNAEEARLYELGEANRFLPVLFCSPTMELGVDISALNVVHMRNVPPTPANYAQRSGRAGRSGQAALVLTYASSQSPHDQYFFRDPRAMVHGAVKAPLLDLANRDLVDSHLQAVWLSCVEAPLDASIAELLVLAEPQRPLRDDLLAAMREDRVRVRAVESIERVLDLVAEDLTPEMAPWYTGRESYAASITATAVDRFSKAFGRWRDLFAAAEEQRDAARRTMDDYAAPYQEKRAAQVRHAQAIDQLNLLQRGTRSLSSDFYTYRYLATEGFLPGYNFPRLPLMAYVPATTDGRGKQTYLQRPRFLALSEFGPRSLVYHEGRAYRVVRALLSLGQRDASTPDAQLPTKSVRICAHCGAGHFDDQASMCHACGTSLGSADIVNHVYRIENVATQPAERITANDEERQRQGFELQTTFKWAQRDHELDVRNATVVDASGDVARLAYGPGATITRLNKGLRRRADKEVLGFKIDPVSGYWAKNEDEDDNQDPTASPRQWIVPSVQDHKNALLFTPLDTSLNETSIATLQHALLRGIEAVFQLEVGEILAEPMPTRDVRNAFLCYEATEGGAGVLARLVAEPESLATVARRALQVMHFDVPDEGVLPSDAEQLVDQPETACVAACYRCLMSYYNQPDHERIDRRDEGARALLLRLAKARAQSAPTIPPPSFASPGATGDWATEAAACGVPPADAEPLVVGGVKLPLVWRRHYVVALHGEVSPDLVARLDDLGFEVIRFDARSTWSGAFERLVSVLRRTA